MFLLSSFWISSGHRCRPLSPSVGTFICTGKRVERSQTACRFPSSFAGSRARESASKRFCPRKSPVHASAGLELANVVDLRIYEVYHYIRVHHRGRGQSGQIQAACLHHTLDYRAVSFRRKRNGRSGKQALCVYRNRDHGEHYLAGI